MVSFGVTFKHCPGSCFQHLLWEILCCLGTGRLQWNVFMWDDKYYDCRISWGHLMEPGATLQACRPLWCLWCAVEGPGVSREKPHTGAQVLVLKTSVVLTNSSGLPKRLSSLYTTTPLSFLLSCSTTPQRELSHPQFSTSLGLCDSPLFFASLTVKVTCF